MFLNKEVSPYFDQLLLFSPVGQVRISKKCFSLKLVNLYVEFDQDS